MINLYLFVTLPKILIIMAKQSGSTRGGGGRYASNKAFSQNRQVIAGSLTPQEIREYEEGDFEYVTSDWSNSSGERREAIENYIKQKHQEEIGNSEDIKPSQFKKVKLSDYPTYTIEIGRRSEITLWKDWDGSYRSEVSTYNGTVKLNGPMKVGINEAKQKASEAYNKYKKNVGGKKLKFDSF